MPALQHAADAQFNEATALHVYTVEDYIALWFTHHLNLCFETTCP